MKNKWRKFIDSLDRRSVRRRLDYYERQEQDIIALANEAIRTGREVDAGHLVVDLGVVSIRLIP